MLDKIAFFVIIFFAQVMLAQISRLDLTKAKWTFNEIGQHEKHAAIVPGTVHTDLFNNQIIPDPFYGDNEKQLRYLDEKDWQYETTFTVNSLNIQNEQIHLVCEGLDTYAQVYLNNEPLFYADNIFRLWQKDIKKYLKIGDNHLKIHFFSANKIGEQLAKKLDYTLPEGERVFVRKTQHHFGWDWSPRFISAGIWQPIYIEFWNNAKIKNLQYEQLTLTEQQAELEFTINIDCEKSGEYALIINDQKSNLNLLKGENLIKEKYTINQPKRWWCNGLGEPNLYDFNIQLLLNEKPVDSKQKRIGLRTIELVQTPDEKGKSFYFKINGESVFIKGANFIPPDHFLPRVSKSDYFNLVKQAKIANMNMLRVWGGGTYADQAFMDACDEMGIMVWHDFMFACAMYPGDKTFLNNVKEEVTYQINRLQHHASLALWCGNNEIDEGWHNWGWQKQFKYTKKDSTKIWQDYVKLFHELIPQTLSELVPKSRNIYWSSSPSKGWGRKESLLVGDVHYWGVWWGLEPFDTYKEKVGRFVSEYGFQGMPPMESFRLFLSKDQLSLASAAMKTHQKHPKGRETIQTYMSRDFKVPVKFEDYVYVSQLLQAEGMKTAIEAHRRAMPYCMGTLYWQFNDCWPVTSWSSIDYYGRWKAMHYQAKKSFENLIVSINEKPEVIEIFLINDRLEKFAGQLSLKVIDFNGQSKWEISKSAHIDKQSSQSVHLVEKEQIKSFLDENHVLVVTFDNKRAVCHANHLFVKPKMVNWMNPDIKWNMLDQQTLEITSNVFAKSVYLTSEDVFFEDNFFDLLPNESKKVKFNGKISNLEINCLNKVR
jgi:beta-mannosidase